MFVVKSENEVWVYFRKKIFFLDVKNVETLWKVFIISQIYKNKELLKIQYGGMLKFSALYC